MVKLAPIGHGSNVVFFLETADLQGWFLIGGLTPGSGSGFQIRGGLVRACVDLRRCLGFLGDQSFPDPSASSSKELICACCRLGRGQLRARCPGLRQRKHPPMRRRHSRSSLVNLLMASSSIGAGPCGSYRGFGRAEGKFRGRIWNWIASLVSASCWALSRVSGCCMATWEATEGLSPLI